MEQWRTKRPKGGKFLDINSHSLGCFILVLGRFDRWKHLNQRIAPGRVFTLLTNLP